MSVLTDLVKAFSGRSVLVFGDVMLDEYLWGVVTRISPEAPVPVVEAVRRSYAAGGAANVAVNVAALDGRAYLCGVVGRDVQRNHLLSELATHNIDAEGLLVDESRPTTTKTRIIANSQQVVRVDAERRETLPAELETALLERAEKVMVEADVCLLSDYGKGVVSRGAAERFIALARRAGRPVLVDPKGTDYSKYRGATLVTPNVQEVERAVNRQAGDERELHEIARELLKVLEEGSLLVTRGAQGMSLFQGGHDVFSVPAMARQVFDVTGAGDTAISALALALASGGTLEQSARIANYAAGLVVGKVGTAYLTRDELAAAVGSDPSMSPPLEKDNVREQMAAGY